MPLPLQAKDKSDKTWMDHEITAHLPQGESPEDGFSDSLLLRPIEVREGTHKLSRRLPPPRTLCLTASRKFERPKDLLTNSSHKNSKQFG